MLNFFWKEWVLALRVSILANIASSLIAVPLLLLSAAEGSIWVSLIAAGASLKDFPTTEIVIYLMGFLIIFMFFFVAFVISVLTEFLIGKVLKAPEKNIFKYFTVANLATYSLIVLSLIVLGFWFGLTNQDPYVDIFDFVYAYFVDPLPVTSSLLFLQGGSFLIGFLLIIFLLIRNYHNPSNKSL